MKNTIVSVLSLTLILASVPAAYAGGALETFDFTNPGPSPIPGEILLRHVPMKWDSRCIPVPFKINNTLDPIPNRLGPAFLSVADATTALQQALDAWNNIPTSFINMQIVGTTSDPGPPGFDFVNELTFHDPVFPAFPAIAQVRTITFNIDAHLMDGDDIDEDGDSDISSAITSRGDVDNDGDFEFPAGFYKAGTLLDTDVRFDSRIVRWTIDPAAADTDFRSVDLIGLATHEFGHCLGLCHSLNNQKSATDGDGATMNRGGAAGDPAEELSLRTLDTDDIAFASLFYPEGSAATGPGALQPGDVAFDSVYGLITGELRHGVLNQPIAGGSVFAVDRDTGVLVASAYTGTTQISFNPATNTLRFVPDVRQAILDGKYVLPVPGGNYSVGVEATDDFPLVAGINRTTRVGAFFRQQDFLEEFFNGNKEGVVEREPAEAKNVHVRAGQTQAGIDIATNRIISINNFGTQDLIDLGFAPNTICCFDARPGQFYAVAIPASKVADAFSQIEARNRGHDVLLQAALFYTFQFDPSVPVVLAEAMLTTGVINPDNTATIDTANPLQRVAPFVAQDDDFAHFYFKNPDVLGRKVRRGIELGEIQNLFLVMRVPTSIPFPGAHGFAPEIGWSKLPAGIEFGQSFVAEPDGARFVGVRGFNIMISLIISEPERHEHGDFHPHAVGEHHEHGHSHPHGVGDHHHHPHTHPHGPGQGGHHHPFRQGS